MSFGEFFVLPELAPLALLLTAGGWLLLRIAEAARRRRLERVIGPRHALLCAEFGPRRRALRRGLFALGIAAAVVAWMQPSFGVDPERRRQRGVDVLICLDVSRSMLATDVLPSRLDRAKHEIEAFAGRLLGDRLGLVVFAGEAKLAVPFTQDVGSFGELLRLAGPASVRRGGSDLGAALDAAATAIDGSDSGEAAVVLITDGEDLGGRGLRAAEAFAERGIEIHCVGIGSQAGSKITIDGPGGETFLADRSGDEVVSSMDAAGLQRIAEVSGGAFVDARSEARPLVALYEQHLRSAARGRPAGAAPTSARMNRFQWPLGLAVLAWLLELTITDRRAPRLRQAAGNGGRR